MKGIFAIGLFAVSGIAFACQIIASEVLQPFQVAPNQKASDAFRELAGKIGTAYGTENEENEIGVLDCCRFRGHQPKLVSVLLRSQPG